MDSRPHTVLGIETSCDETAAALVRRWPDGRGEILASRVLSQIRDHAPYGGVVPEIAARSHMLHLESLVTGAIGEAGVRWSDIDAVAATAGPGLLGGLLVGLTAAKAMALALERPFLAINHLEGHALTPGLTDGLRPPYLLLLISGGHTQTLAVHDVGSYARYGTTIDDAVGEAFDKTAKLLGLGYPGGPAVEARARQGDPARFVFPRPLAGRATEHFSFSGLKTAVRLAVDAARPLQEKDIDDICAGFEAAVTDTLVSRTRAAMVRYRSAFGDRRPVLVVAGGVAANARVRHALAALIEREGFALSIPPAELCTDNAAMIAWAGAERLVRGMIDDVDAMARARWPLDTAAEPAPGAGVKA
ncbi:MAG TPA: tRNA (adenosine(37)-N6)-threonylcarbamoyltransferase complex transferase subunit TsaD [Aestuariivirgaceae bacterium]|nr:tRNA (adenosine(37)-N6)-threonylcarbamoyltransferase complex transferase subunit TsaD [Aestuariivirgaceae bacterium]